MDLVGLAGLLHPDQSLSLSQAIALHELDADAGMSQQELTTRLRLEKSTVSRLVAQMEKQGFLVRERDPANHRVYRLRLTRKGSAAHARLRTEFHDRHTRLIAGMKGTEREALLVGLRGLVRVLRDKAGASTH
jgi:DNA-binding MarR family transcriptional regulator